MGDSPEFPLYAYALYRSSLLRSLLTTFVCLCFTNLHSGHFFPHKYGSSEKDFIDFFKYKTLGDVRSYILQLKFHLSHRRVVNKIESIQLEAARIVRGGNR